MLDTYEGTVWDALDAGAAQYVVAPVSTDARHRYEATRVEAALAAGAPHADVPRAREDGSIHPLGGVATVTVLGGESTEAAASGLLPPRLPEGGYTPPRAAATRGVLAVQWHRAAEAPRFRAGDLSRALARIENVWPRPRAVVFPRNAAIWGAASAALWRCVGAWASRSGIRVIVAELALPPEARQAPPATPREALRAALATALAPAPPPLPAPVSTPLPAPAPAGPSARASPDGVVEQSSAARRSGVVAAMRELESRGAAARESAWAQGMVGAHLGLTVDDVAGLYGRLGEAERARMRCEVVQGSDEWLALRRGRDVMGRVAALLREHVPAGAAAGTPEAAAGVAAARERVLDVLAGSMPRLTSSKAYAVVFTAMNRAMDAARRAGRELPAPPFYAEEAARGARGAERVVREMLLDKLGGGSAFKGSRFTRWGNAHEEGGVAAYAEAARRGLVVGPRAAPGAEFAVLSSLKSGPARGSVTPRAEVERIRDGGGIHVHPERPFFAFSYDALFRIAPQGGERVVRHVEVKCPGNPYASLCPEHRIQIISMLDGLRAEGTPVDGCDYVVHMPHSSTRVTRVPFVQAEADFIMNMLEAFMRRELAPLLIARWEGRLPAGSLEPSPRA